MSKLCKDCACENVCGITHLPEDKACGFYYKAEAVTELEKIKEKIGEAYPYFDSADVHWGFDICRDIIDNRIKELKGENKCNLMN